MRKSLGLFKGKCEDGQWRMGYYYGIVAQVDKFRDKYIVFFDLVQGEK